VTRIHERRNQSILSPLLPATLSSMTGTAIHIEYRRGSVRGDEEVKKEAPEETRSETRDSETSEDDKKDD